MSKIGLPESPLYDPKTIILKFKHEEDFSTLRFNLLGTGQVFTDTKFSYYIDETKEWRRPKEICNNPKFIDGDPKRFDALQGKTMGDCWLITGIEALTLNKKLARHVVPGDQDFGKNYIGAFHFRIWQLGFWYDVVVDDRLPVEKSTKELCYAHSMSGDVFWAALLEKAYAKISGIFTDVSFDGLFSGRGMTSLEDLTGGIVEVIKTREKASSDLKLLLSEVHADKALMIGSCDKEEEGLHSGHTYSVTKVFKTDENDPDYHGLFLIRMMNPWGHGEWQGDWSDADYNLWRQIDRDIKKKLHITNKDDGEFWLDEVDLAKYFKFIYICHLGPGQYLKRLTGKTFDKWRSTVFYGEWVKGETAGGSSAIARHINPQYRILLDWPENDANRDGDCTVIIELIQREKSNRRKKHNIAFFVYTLSIEHDIPVPLTKQFLDRNEPTDKNPDFSMGLGRNYIAKMDLHCPGKYCIIPCTKDFNIESQFMLRVFSESRVNMWEYDTQISKSLPTEDQSMQNFDERLKRLFDNVAQGKEKLDWIGLMEILEAEMNKKRSFYRMISSLVTFFENIFENMFTRRSSNDYKDSDSVFSKDECRSMIAMVDDNQSGKISFSEFIKLWNKICFWTKVYENQKDETEGYVTVAHLRDALSSIGYNVNKRTIHSLSYVYAYENGNIPLTDFILCGVSLETVLALNEKKCKADENKVSFTLEEWVKNTLIL